ncbi:MAG: hypothetical protein ACSHXF_04760 [Aquaticitalea sp.]
MENTIESGLAPFQQNGHDTPTQDHEVLNGLHQNNLLMEEVLENQEQEAPTAKMDSPEAEPTKAKTARAVETGFAVNVQNLRLVRQRIVGFGPSYIQGSPLFTIENMQTVYDEAMSGIAGFNTAKQADDQATDHVQTVFENLESDSTRTKNIFIWCGVSEKAIKRMEYLNHQIQGTRVEAIAKDDMDDHISTSHTSRTQQIQHARELALFLADYPQYLPPPDLTASAWSDRAEAMDLAQFGQNVSSSDLKMARVKRNIAIYKRETGVVEIGLGAKRTVLGIYGFNSPEYNMIKGIKFTRIKGWEYL